MDKTHFHLVAAVNDDATLAACLARSPDVQSGRLPLTAIRGASSMAQAYNQALAQSDADIVVLAHQDVYLPAGWLDRAAVVTGELARAHPDWLAAGPYGVRADGRLLADAAEIAKPANTKRVDRAPYAGR